MTEVRAQRNDLPKKNTFCVTVTYGNRAHFLRQMLDALRSKQVSRVVVVNNGAAWPVKAELTAAYSDFVDVVDMGVNTGSAKGFATGIQRALDLGAEYIWLLDDDNRPHSNTLQILHKAYSDALKCTPGDRLAVVAFRPDHQADVAMGVATHRINPLVNSFRGFHYRDIPYKIWRRTPWGRPKVRGALPATVRLDTAPYSGLLFHRDLIEAIGLPDENFVLYADDTEFTYRIARSGGSTLLVTSALLDDLESSWNVKKRFSNSLVGMLKGDGDLRAFYCMRNGVYFDSVYLKRSSVVFGVNRIIYMSLLFLFAMASNKRERFGLLRRAVADGLSGRLGVNERYPL
jgi:GT2 family glycosyltransferase